MRRAAAVPGLMPLLLAGCATPQDHAAGEPDLSGLLAFADPHACRPAPTLDRLLRTLLRDTTALPVKYGPVEVPDRFRPFVGPARLGRRADTWEATAALHGRWLGLPVTGVVARGYDGGDGAGFRILFHAPRAATEAAVRRAGFPVQRPRPLGPRPEWLVTVTPAGNGTTALGCTVNG